MIDNVIGLAITKDGLGSLLFFLIPLMKRFMHWKNEELYIIL